MPGASNSGWGGATVTVTVGGVDVSCDLIGCHIDRSKNRVWDPADAGLCRITLDITATGQPASRGPSGSIVKVNIAYGSVNRDLFTGRVQRRLPHVDPVQGDQLVLECVDEFEQLGRRNLRAASGDAAVGAGEYVTDRINRWLDEGGSTSPRAIGTSTYTCPSVLLDGNILRQLQATVQADGGDVFIDGAGTVTFLPWAWQITADSAVALFSDRRQYDWVPYSNAHLTDDLDEVQNKVTGTRRPISDTDLPEPQTATVPSSVSAYGERGDALDNLELDSDTQVVTRVTGLVGVAGAPNARFDSIIVQPAFDPARSWPRTIPVTFGTLIAANRQWADGTDTALYGHVIGEIWDIGPTDITVEWRCSGTGTWDVLRPPRLPIALVPCADGSWRVPPGYPCDMTSEVIAHNAAGDVLATWPAGSACHCGVVYPPEGTTSICYFDGTTEVCYDITPETSDAILWFDVLEPGPNLIERVDGDAVPHGYGFSGTVLNDIPGLHDSIWANADGGLIGHENSTHLGDVGMAGGWTIDFWFWLPTSLPGDVLEEHSVIVVDLDTVQVVLRWVHASSDPTDFAAWFVINTQVDLTTGYITPPLTTNIPTAAYHEWRFGWNPTENLLTVLMDGANPP